MTLRVFIISLLGMGIVFGFLAIIYLLLFCFKFIFHRKLQKETVLQNGEVPGEEIVAILTSFEHYIGDNLKGKKIIIKNRREEK